MYIKGHLVQREKGQVIEFFAVHTGESEKFDAFLTDFQDSFQSEWGSEEVYGRMDPIQTFKGTKRTISLAWDLVADSKKEAVENMSKAAHLFRMLYPTYEGTTMKASPIIRLKVANLVEKANAESGSSAKDSGLTGTIDGFAYSPDLEQGFFEHKGKVYPQTIALECTFIVMHTHDLGVQAKGGATAKSRFPESFPYTAVALKGLE